MVIQRKLSCFRRFKYDCSGLCWIEVEWNDHLVFHNCFIAWLRFCFLALLPKGIRNKRKQRVKILNCVNEPNRQSNNFKSAPSLRAMIFFKFLYLIHFVSIKLLKSIFTNLVLWTGRWQVSFYINEHGLVVLSSRSPFLSERQFCTHLHCSSFQQKYSRTFFCFDVIARHYNTNCCREKNCQLGCDRVLETRAECHFS